MSVVESCVLPQHLVEHQVMHRRLSHTAWKRRCVRKCTSHFMGILSSHALGVLRHTLLRHPRLPVDRGAHRESRHGLLAQVLEQVRDAIERSAKCVYQNSFHIRPRRCQVVAPSCSTYLY